MGGDISVSFSGALNSNLDFELQSLVRITKIACYLGNITVEERCE